VEKSLLFIYFYFTQFPQHSKFVTMAANLNAVNNAIPAEVTFDDMLGRIGLNVHARDKFRQVFGNCTGDEFVQMDVHKKPAMYLQTAIAVELLARFSKKLANGVMAACHYTQYQVSLSPDSWTLGTYAAETAKQSEAMQCTWLEHSRLLGMLMSTPPTLTIAAFTDMQRFLAFKANTVATCATACSFETGACYKYLLRRFGTVTAEARAATYATIDLDLIATTMHSGVCFEEDNSILYCANTTAVGEGKLGAFIDTFHETANGRGAYLALTDACYSPSLATSCAKTCKQVLHNLRWGTGMDLEAYIRTTLEQHALIAGNANEESPFTERDKALLFRRGLSENKRYRSVVIPMPANTSYEAVCEAICTVVMDDTELNRNSHAADNRTIICTGNAANVPNAPRHSASSRPARTAPTAPSCCSGAGTIKGYKLPKSGIQLHNGEYLPEDIKLLREHGEYEEMRAFHTQNNTRRCVPFTPKTTCGVVPMRWLHQTVKTLMSQIKLATVSAALALIVTSQMIWPAYVPMTVVTP
jgi:hypothetical protein